MVVKGASTLESENISIDGLDGNQFEELIAKIMKRRGYVDIQVTQKNRGDLGKDIIMRSNNGEIIVVECKHQHFVGRPIVQKLQGAMHHEEAQNSNKIVRGIIVTSGSFSNEAITYIKEIKQEIELIDGKKLKKICQELNVVILNGKVQILTNKSFKVMDGEESEKLSSHNYSKIYGHEKIKPSITNSLKFAPACYIRYSVAFDTHTSIGCVDEYDSSGEIIVNGITGKELNEDVKEFFFEDRYTTEDISQKNVRSKIPYEFTENDIEEHAINQIIKEHSHIVNYRGQNNVSYSKECVPKRRDIDILEFIPLYLPLWKNDIGVLEQQYHQEFYSKSKHQLFIHDGLKICKICEREKRDYDKMSLCPECGRIVCGWHVKIDYLDKKTPICTLHAKAFKLFLQKKYFAYKENRKEYGNLWKKMNFFKKLYEDKIAFSLIIVGLVGLAYLIYSITNV